MQTDLAAHRRRALASPDEVLRQAVPDQLRHRRGHRHRAGVPVRDELERVLPLRRRRLRRAAGDRGPGRLLPRVDLPRPVDLRLGPAAPRRSTWRRIWLVAIGTNLSAYFILAANSFMQHPVGVRFNAGAGRAELTSIWRVLTNHTAAGRLPAHRRRCAPRRRHLRRRRSPAWWMVRAHRQRPDLDAPGRRLPARLPARAWSCC